VFPESDRAEIATAVTGILTTGALTLGAYTREFESAFASAHENRAGALNAIAVSSGTAALEIVLRGIGVAGRDVIVPATPKPLFRLPAPSASVTSSYDVGKEGRTFLVREPLENPQPLQLIENWPALLRNK